MPLTCNDPTILTLRRALDSQAVSLKVRELSAHDIVELILSNLPNDCVKLVSVPALGTGPADGLSVSFNCDFYRYVAFAAEYWINLVQGGPPLRPRPERC